MKLPSRNHHLGSQRGLVATTMILVLIGLVAALITASQVTIEHTRRELRSIDKEQVEKFDSNSTRRKAQPRR